MSQFFSNVGQLIKHLLFATDTRAWQVFTVYWVWIWWGSFMVNETILSTSKAYGFLSSITPDITVWRWVLFAIAFAGTVTVLSNRRVRMAVMLFLGTWWLFIGISLSVLVGLLNTAAGIYLTFSAIAMLMYLRISTDKDGNTSVIMGA